MARDEFEYGRDQVVMAISWCFQLIKVPMQGKSEQAPTWNCFDE